MVAVTDKREIRIGKRLRAAKAIYNIEDGIRILKEVNYTKFDETLEVVMRLGVDPRHSDQMVRDVDSLPAGTGKTTRVAVICKDKKIVEALDVGADIAGSVDVIEEIEAGKINFDICIATPDMMAVIGQVARILGPKGMMPNPKLGTIMNEDCCKKC